ncbi:MAG: polysaccharide deacetylase family protein [Planctomycetota bacterium]|nr:polysaccharide deacetylase family protein [Planctomycetota bacterium]MDA1212907.1 polysaccharide deacetylase family protein [Planctomycetota bacterium]
MTNRDDRKGKRHPHPALSQRERVNALTFAFALTLLTANIAHALEPIPDKLVVLTFDDSVKSHYTIARPILKKYGFGATFFITEGFTFTTNKTDYMTWDEIRELHDDGFEIGNHTRDHMSVTPGNYQLLEEQLGGIDAKCEEFGIPKPTSFAWPGNSLALEALPVLHEHGIRFARRGGAPEYPYDYGEGVAYQPTLDDPLLIPSAGDARPDWQLGNFIQAVNKAKDGRIAVLQFHGVPEGEHPWVHTPEELFEVYMRYLHLNGFTVIAIRDLSNYVDADVHPNDPWAVITYRQAEIAQANAPPPTETTSERTTDENDSDFRTCSPPERLTRIRHRLRSRTRRRCCY